MEDINSLVFVSVPHHQKQCLPVPGNLLARSQIKILSAKHSDNLFVEPSSWVFFAIWFGTVSVYCWVVVYAEIDFLKKQWLLRLCGCFLSLLLKEISNVNRLCKGTRDKNPPIPRLFEVREALWCFCGFFQSVPQFSCPDQWAEPLSEIDVKPWVFLNTNNKD